MKKLLVIIALLLVVMAKGQSGYVEKVEEYPQFRAELIKAAYELMNEYITWCLDSTKHYYTDSYFTFDKQTVVYGDTVWTGRLVTDTTYHKVSPSAQGFFEWMINMCQKELDLLDWNDIDDQNIYYEED